MGKRSNWFLSMSKFFSYFVKLQPGEGPAVALFCLYGFLVMFSYYMLKTLREPLLLVGSSAEIKSYAAALIALILFFAVPAYGLVFKHVKKQRLSWILTGFLICNLLAFYFLGQAEIDIGFSYYVWVGIFSVFIVAQFWAYATDTFNVKAGQRLFPIIMVGVSIGGLVGPIIAGFLFNIVGPMNIMLLTVFILLLTFPLIEMAQKYVPLSSSCVYADSELTKHHLLGGFGLVMNSRYLMLVAALVVVLNWVNSTGEYILSEMVVQNAQEQVASNPMLDKGQLIANFYGSFFSIVNALSLFIQIFLVSRIFRWVGVQGALFILPVIALIGYGLVVFIPIFSILRVVKIFENSTDYSLMNTSRQALFLPLNESEKYQSKVAIDTFFWRFGDLIQAAGIYLGLHLFGFETKHFAILNMCLAVLWIVLAAVIGKHYLRRRSHVTIDEPPILVRNIPPFSVAMGEEILLHIPDRVFVSADAGDVIDYDVRAVDSKTIPSWMKFDKYNMILTGKVPLDLQLNTWLILRATNMDGGWSETKFMIEHK